MVCNRLATFADDALEITVVGSFSALGYTARRRLWGWSDAGPGALDGRTVAITGPTSGLGRELALAVARLGARVVLIGRDAAKLEALRSALAAETGEDRYPVVVADMASLDDVHAAAAAITEREDRLDVLVDNAGAIHPERRETPDGLDAMFALLVAGPFVLESGLLPLLRRTPGSRVIAMTSGGMYTQRLPLDDLQDRSGEYSGPRAYARAKRAQVALMREWSRRLRGEVAFTAMHPGWADTPGLAEALPGFRRLMRPILRTPGQGIDTAVWLATQADPQRLSGRLYLDRRPVPFDRIPATRLDARDRRWLWERVADLAGVAPAGRPRAAARA
jgi:NAD(P)-dependent dehydrogenase (short-subunit alcohol dehydrogenase family)